MVREEFAKLKIGDCVTRKKLSGGIGYYIVVDVSGKKETVTAYSMYMDEDGEKDNIELSYKVFQLYEPPKPVSKVKFHRQGYEVQLTKIMDVKDLEFDIVDRIKKEVNDILKGDY